MCKNLLHLFSTCINIKILKYNFIVRVNIPSSFWCILNLVNIFTSYDQNAVTSYDRNTVTTYAQNTLTSYNMWELKQNICSILPSFEERELVINSFLN